MSNDILDKGSPVRRIIVLLTLLLLLISALIFLFNRASFLGNGKTSTEPVVIGTDGAIKTFPDDAKKNGEMPAAKVYDMLQKTPPTTNKKPDSVKAIIDNNQTQPAANKTPANQNNKPATALTTKDASKNKPTPSISDLVARNDGKNNKNTQGGAAVKKTTDKAIDKKSDKKAVNKNDASKDASSASSVSPGNYVLQLASFTDEATAQKYLTAMKPRLEKIIAGRGISYKVATGRLATGQQVYRSQVLGFQTKAQAEETCQKIKSQLTTSGKPDCLVLKSF